jgi:archaellum component FlaD/FlaE
MSTAALTPLQTVVPVVAVVAPLLIVLLAGGVVGMSIRNMFESIMSEGGDDDAGDGAGGDLDGDGLMAEDGGSDGSDTDDLGGLGGLDDDGLGGFGGEDEFGEMDDGGGAGGNVDELEHRLEEMENEVGSLSSTVNTVRNENEQISESVEEVEENVRKLLDIYEMVTRGVNPFADDIDAGMGGGMSDGGSFGLFDDGDDGGKAEEDLDEDIAGADAEGFFDEDLVEDGEETMAADGDVGEVLGGDVDAEPTTEEAFDDEFDAFDDDFGGEVDEGGERTDTVDDGDDGGAGTSFADLKEEYESGDAEWADDEDDEVADTGDFQFDEEPDDAAGEGAEEDAAALEAELADDDLFDEVVGDEGETGAEEEPTADAEREPAGADPAGDVPGAEGAAEEAGESAGPEPDAGAATAESTTTGAEPSAEGETVVGSTDAAGDDGKPYLGSLPEGFGSDLIAIEWLEFLVDEVGVRETDRALDYYERIDWIDETVADDLSAYLQGFDAGGSGSLTIDHHKQSLRYIDQLDGGTAGVARLLDGGGLDGVQR